jgi:methionyl-tRNA formyltransferase
MDKKKPLNLVFAGTPEFGLPALRALHQSHHRVVAVYTQPDRPVGRGQKCQASPIKQWALDHHIPLVQPQNFKSDDEIAVLKSFQPDVMVVIAYGLILPQKVLSIPRLGCVNVHASLLPHWRGASPIQSALLHGDEVTGVSIMQMDAGMDTGAVLKMAQLTISSEDTAGTLHDRLSQLAIEPLLDVLNQSPDEPWLSQPQNATQASYAKKIAKEDAHIIWQQSAQVIERQIRAYQPWPVAFTLHDQQSIRLYRAQVVSHPSPKEPGTILKLDAQGLLVACGRDALLIQEFQFPGGKRIAVDEWLRGHKDRLIPGMKLT